MSKTYNKSQYRVSLILSLLLHVAVIIFVFISIINMPKMPSVMQTKPKTKIINAVSINQQQVEQQIAKIKASQQQKKSQEATRLASIKKQQQKLVQQKQQQIVQQKKLHQQQAAQAKAAQQKLSQIQQQQQQAQQQLKQAQQQLQQAKQQAQALATKQAAEKKAAQEKAAQAKAKALAQQKQKAALEKQFQQQVEAEQQKLAKVQAQQINSVVDKYKALILSSIAQQWIVPNNADKNLSCELAISLAPGGKVLNVNVIHSSGNTALDRSAVTAVYKASPLPVPSNPEIFNTFKNLNLTVRPETVMS